jgi:signal peptidase II
MAVIVLDQWLKYWVITHLPFGETLNFLPKVLSLTYVRNTGVSFNLFSGNNAIMSVISVLTALVFLTLMLMLLLNYPKSALPKLAISFIAGGAVGNLIDRVTLGYVVDMFETNFINFAVFNVADAFLTVGTFLLAVWILFSERKKTKMK